MGLWWAIRPSSSAPIRFQPGTPPSIVRLLQCGSTLSHRERDEFAHNVG